ncbi:hypothetical protein, partial [Vibrio alginolyticus]|uniref:hypothetical protein n=1 Tax=Vibrio alginolyticus TaxID=663 RepID=UPI003D7E9A67
MIRNAWHFHYALALVFRVVCGSLGICVAHTLTGRYVFSSLLQVTSFNEILLDLGDYSTRCVFQKDYYMRMLKIET